MKLNFFYRNIRYATGLKGDEVDFGFAIINIRYSGILSMEKEDTDEEVFRGASFTVWSAIFFPTSEETQNSVPITPLRERCWYNSW